MLRRALLQTAAAVPLLGAIPPARPRALSRVRPGDPSWPDAAEWDRLNRAVNGRLIRLRSPLTSCRDDPESAACQELFKALKNPYAIGDDPTLTQTCGWIDAWTSEPSAYVVAAESAEDVAAAVNFARERNLRLVVRGGAHSYLGTLSSPDSLMVWTRRMHAVTLHGSFVPQGCDAQAPQSAVSIGAGAIWMHVYNEVTTRHGRYVQGGGCGTVGVAGLVQGGGFGSHSKQFGTAAASLIEAEVVTADGAVRIANTCLNPDLFWALKGGGGGTFGVVTRLTLRTHDLPDRFGLVSATIRAASDISFRQLVSAFLTLCSEKLVNPAWGEIVTLRPGRRVDIRMNWQGLEQPDAEAIWDPFFRQLAGASDDFVFAYPPRIVSGPFRHRWDPSFYRLYAPTAIRTDDRPNAPPDNIFWAANLSEAGHFLFGFESLWLPAELLAAGSRERLADTLVTAARIWPVELHLQKGLAGSTAEVLAAVRGTPINPAVLNAFALAIIAGEGPPGFPGLSGHEPDQNAARGSAARIAEAAGILRGIVPSAAAYVAESGFFQADWQSAYWGPHYQRLLSIKQRYDPSGLFFVHHGVGSESWSEDGFVRAH